jgi:hypothetical protein
VNRKAVLIEQPRYRFMIALTDIEYASLIHYLSAARQTYYHSMLLSFHLISCPKERWNSGVSEHSRLLACLGGTEGRIRQHEMKQPTHASNRIIDRHADAGAERVGCESDRGVVGDGEIGDVDHGLLV